MRIFILFLLMITGCSGDSSGDNSVSTFSYVNGNLKVPGIASAWIQDGTIFEIKTDGVRTAGSSELIESDDAFHLGSCTKAMTATLAAMFIEENKLNWSSTLVELLPGLALHPSYAEMTFENLLVHRAGLPVDHDELFNKVRSMNPTAGREQITRTLLAEAPLTAPGTKYVYSNFSYIIAGHILERLSGKSWEVLMKEKIFNPLGMSSCGFGVTPEVSAHALIDGKFVPKYYDNPEAFGPSSTVHCSLIDWGKFLTIHSKGFQGENNLLHADTYKKLHSVHPSRDSSYTYGGWILQTRAWAKGATLSHAGSNTLNYAKVYIAPNIDSVVMSATNIATDDAIKTAETSIQNLIKKYSY